MKYQRFEDLPVWRAAIDLAVSVYALTAKLNFKGHSDLRDQMERSSVSISNNIAEGFERGTAQELLTFIYIARGSAGELRSMLLFLDRLPDFSDLKSDISNLKCSDSVAHSHSIRRRGVVKLAAALWLDVPPWPTLPRLFATGPRSTFRSRGWFTVR